MLYLQYSPHAASSVSIAFGYDVLLDTPSQSALCIAQGIRPAKQASVRFPGVVGLSVEAPRMSANIHSATKKTASSAASMTTGFLSYFVETNLRLICAPFRRGAALASTCTRLVRAEGLSILRTNLTFAAPPTALAPPLPPTAALGVELPHSLRSQQLSLELA
jgi:hypothetical protein